VAPNIRDGSARRNWADSSIGRRIAPGGGGDAARRSRAQVRPTMQWRHQAVPGADVVCVEDSTQIWMEVFM